MCMNTAVGWMGLLVIDYICPSESVCVLLDERVYPYRTGMSSAVV